MAELEHDEEEYQGPVNLNEPFSLTCAMAPDDRIGCVAIVDPADDQKYVIVEVLALHDDPCPAISELIHGGGLVSKVVLVPANARRLVAAILNCLDVIDPAPTKVKKGKR